MSFLDPQLTKDGKPYGPIRLKEIIKERYLISKNINTSYNDTGKITPLERRYILEFMIEEVQAQKELKESIMNNRSK